MRLRREHLVEVAVVAGFAASGLHIFENGLLAVLADFDQLQAVLDFHVPSFELILEEIIA